MKKVAIAGILAAMPVFSLSLCANTSSITETREIAVVLQDTCAFSRTGGSGDYTGSVLPGGYSENFAMSTFTATCNTPSTYQVTAQFTDLVDKNNSNNIIGYSATTPNGEISNWNVKAGKSISTQANVTNGGQILNATSADGGSAVTVHYSVGASYDQPAGTYVGTATYTLVSGE